MNDFIFFIILSIYLNTAQYFIIIEYILLVLSILLCVVCVIIEDA